MTMIEHMTYEDTADHRRRTLDEAARLYHEDITLRRICDTVTSEALSGADVEDQQAAADMVRKAVMVALVMATGSTDLNYIMRERDMYRDQLLKVINLTDSIPVYRHPDAADDVLGKQPFNQ